MHSKEKSPVTAAAVAIRIIEYLPHGQQSLPLLLVDVPLYAGLPSGDEHCVPQRESAEGQSHRTAEHPEVDDTLVKHSLSEGEGRWGSLTVDGLIACKLQPLLLLVLEFLNGCVGITEHDTAADAAVNAAHGHEKAEGEEVAMVVMANTVIEPRTMMIHFKNTPIANATMVRAGGFWGDAFPAHRHRRNVFLSLLGWISGRCGDGLVVMEHDHDEIPVAVGDVPADPLGGIGLEDERKDTDVDDQYDGAGQDDHQNDKHYAEPSGHVIHQPINGFKQGLDHHVAVGERVVGQGDQAEAAVAHVVGQEVHLRPFPSVSQAEAPQEQAPNVSHPQNSSPGQTARPILICRSVSLSGRGLGLLSQAPPPSLSPSRER